MRILVCISGWRDGYNVLRPCLESAVALGFPVLLLDGAYSTYAPRGPWATPETELSEAIAGLPNVTVTRAMSSRPWLDEAEKRTQLVLAGVAMGADWLLTLDADERLEGEPGALEAYLREDPRPLRWAMLELYQPGVKGYPIPRLVRAHDELTFRPPLDYQLWCGQTRIAYLDGEHVPEELQDALTEIPASVIRIRHDRHLRPQTRLEMSGQYVRERRRQFGVG